MPKRRFPTARNNQRVSPLRCHLPTCSQQCLRAVLPAALHTAISCRCLFAGSYSNAAPMPLVTAVRSCHPYVPVPLCESHVLIGKEDKPEDDAAHEPTNMGGQRDAWVDQTIYEVHKQDTDP